MNVLTEDDLVLVEALLQDLDVRTIARKFDCTVKEIRHRLNLNKTFVSKTSRIRQLYAKGKTRAECAQLVGCGRSLVNYALGNENADPVISPGRVFSKLTVLRLSVSTATRIKRYECVCECGKAHIARHDLLINGKTRHCGCSRHENRRPKIDILSKRAKVYSFTASRTKVNYDAVRLCYDLYTNRKLSITEALKQTGLNASSYYRHVQKAVK